MRAHRVNISSLVVGLVFLGLAGSWALRETGVIRTSDAAWILPLLLVAAGAVGVLAAITRNRPAKRTNHYDIDHGDM